EQIRQINEAYALILDYLESYRFSFCEEEFYRQNPDQQLHRQFGNDPLWGI
ncbi:MAG TPA: molecular chaperone DnaJ, partial [Desulfobulbaceae bacterium]|nr:molecular chaperone DnaJ [Desulfobulbaceae bacterium]